MNDVDVPIRPNLENNSRHYVPLSRFVRYKAFHCRIDPIGSVSSGHSLRLPFDHGFMRWDVKVGPTLAACRSMCSGLLSISTI